jgi:putative phage-type endonuclease
MPELVCAATDPRWQEERRKGITATDLPVILGLASWASPYSLWAQKSDIINPPPDSDRWRLGRELQPYIVRRWAEATERGEGLDGGLWRSTARPWQMATPDRVHWTLDGTYPEAVLEVKSWADMDRHAWDDGPPPAVRAQILWQMDVMDVPAGHWGVLFLPSGEFRHGVIEHGTTGRHLSAERCNWCKDILMMRSAGRDFLDLIYLGTPPDVDGSAATLAALRARFTPAEGPAAEVDESLWDMWLSMKSHAAVYKSNASECEAKIREQLGTATRIKVDGKIAGRRIIATAQVKAHERRQDYIRAVNGGGNGDE